jgi:putative DNA primase/helicase
MEEVSEDLDKVNQKVGNYSEIQENSGHELQIDLDNRLEMGAATRDPGGLEGPGGSWRVGSSTDFSSVFKRLEQNPGGLEGFSEGALRGGIPPDRGEAERFLGTLDPTTVRFTFQTFDDVELTDPAKPGGKRKRGDKSLLRVLHGTLAEHWEELVRLNRRGAGIFVTVNETDGRGRKDENITRVRAVWQDDDAGYGWTLSLAPSIEVQTSPGKHQRYLIADGLSVDDHAAAMRVMVEDHGCDKGAKDLPRVLRVPGFHHMKEQHRPYLVRIVGGDGRRYTADEVKSALPASPKPRQSAKPNTRTLMGKLGLLTKDEEAEYRSVADYLHEATGGAEFNDRDTWLQHGIALHHKTNGHEQGSAIWSELSEKYATNKYDAERQRYDWHSFANWNGDKPLTLATIYKRARNLGYKTEAEKEQSEIDAEVDRLARLSPGLYDRQREKAAKRLQIRVSTLDGYVSKRREELSPKTGGTSVLFPEDPVWEDPVDGAELLDKVVATLERFSVLPDNAAPIIALWILFSHCVDAATIAPILAILSPEKRCGKTTLLLLIMQLVAKGLSAGNISPAGIYRAIPKYRPTLGLDEADRWLHDQASELIGIVNAGHIRGTPCIRCVGDEHDVEAFDTFGAKVIAAIGNLPDTIQDRSIPIALRRKLPSETVEKFRQDRVQELVDIRRQLSRWAADNIDAVRAQDPRPVEGLNDRADDNFRILAAIADVIGGDWPERLRKAALALSGKTQSEDNHRIKLLADIRRLFDTWPMPQKNAEGRTNLVPTAVNEITSGELPDKLSTLAEPALGWSTYTRGKPITSDRIARWLKDFGVKSQKREGNNVFVRADFEDAWKRYLPDTPSSVTLPNNPPALQENALSIAISRAYVETTNPPGPSRTLQPSSQPGSNGASDHAASLLVGAKRRGPVEIEPDDLQRFKSVIRRPAEGSIGPAQPNGADPGTGPQPGGRRRPAAH